jgi:acetyl-CoA synthetase
MSDNIETAPQPARSFPPPPAFSEGAQPSALALEALYREAAADHSGFWSRLARRNLSWKLPFTRGLDESNAPFFTWFADGWLNAAHNALDRHLAGKGDKTALIFEEDGGAVRRYSYRELHAEVCRLANGLRALGLRKGERVVIYLSMGPQALMAMLACARIGAIHSVVFGGFSADALRERIRDAGASLVITADAAPRGGRLVPLKDTVDAALAAGCDTVRRVIVHRRSGAATGWDHERDLWWDDAVAGQLTVCEPEWVEAEFPLFLLYTSGSTGKPKGVQHSTAGYLLGAMASMQWVFDPRPDDVFWCTADVGWITGHSYVCYGPLLNGMTQVIFEGVPTWPDAERFWSMIERHQVSVFYTAPTAIRALMRHGDELPRRHDLSSLRLLGTVGEPINEAAWLWYHRVIGAERCPIVDTWWQTETGAAMIAPVPGVVPAKPGSCARPLPGIAVAIVDEQGQPVAAPDQGGTLVVTRPWPSMLRTIWGDDERYQRTYFGQFGHGVYVTGDGAQRDADGDLWILGRIDDVLNVSGHRLGTMEIESALASHPRVAEAAVVGRPHEIKGEAVLAFVIARGERQAAQEQGLAAELREWVAARIGAIARPDEIRFVDALPKTRSGKIMRRLLRSIGRGESITQDTSTLENEALLGQLRAGEPKAAA